MENLSRSSAIEARAQNQSSSSRRRQIGTQITTLWENITAAQKPWSLYEALPKEGIRLLRLLVYDSGEMHCHLQTFDRNETPDYDALSYCWGESLETTTIYCNSRAVQIRTSLYTALKHIWEGATLPTRYLWIDAVCLNQDDNDEKAHQVPRMGEIYSRATETLIWLGEAADDSDAAIGFVESCRASSQDGAPLEVRILLLILQCRWKDLKESLGNLDHDSLKATLAGAKQIARTFAEGGDDAAELLDVVHSFLVDPIAKSHLEDHIEGRLLPISHQYFIVKALYALISRPWFSRLWVVQELALSASCRLICGDVSVDCAALGALTTNVPLTSLLTICASAQAESRLEDSADCDDYRGRAPIIQLDSLLRLTGRTRQRIYHKYGFAVWLESTESRKCQEPVDRVWAVVALLPEIYRQRIRNADMIDYTVIGRQQYWTSYLCFMQLLATENQADFWFTVLCSQGRSKHPSLPSWCPDFNGRRRHRNPMFSTIAIGKARAGFPSADDMDDTLIQNMVIPYTVTASLLKAHGFAIDVVRKSTDPAPSPEGPVSKRDYLKFVQQVFLLTGEVDDFGLIENLVDSICQILLGVWSPAEWSNEREKDKAQRFYQATSYAWLGCFQHHPGIDHFADLTRSIADEEGSGFSLVGGRSFFNTVQGRIGLGPADLACGDLVCIFPGVAVPLILRTADVESLLSGGVHTPASLKGYSELFHLVGDASLLGCMNGEAFTAEGRGPNDIFVLV